MAQVPKKVGKQKFELHVASDLWAMFARNSDFYEVQLLGRRRKHQWERLKRRWATKHTDDGSS
jgi:hypothetical protein